jgi:hypothetical protein
VGGRQQPKGDFQLEGYLMFNSFRYFGLMASSVVAATVASTGVSLADVAKIPTKFVNRLPLKIIVTFEGTGVPTGPWYADKGETKTFLLLPIGAAVKWKIIPAVTAGAGFTLCTGTTQQIGYGISGSLIVLNDDHCDGKPQAQKPPSSSGVSASSSPSGSGSGSGAPQPKPSGTVSYGSYKVAVKNNGKRTVKVQVKFHFLKDGNFVDGYGYTDDIKPGGTGEAKIDWAAGTLAPAVIDWRAYTNSPSDYCDKDQGSSIINPPIQVVCN